MSTNDSRAHVELLRGTLDLFIPRTRRSTNRRTHLVIEIAAWEMLAQAIARIRHPATQE